MKRSGRFAKIRFVELFATTNPEHVLFDKRVVVAHQRIGLRLEVGYLVQIVQIGIDVDFHHLDQLFVFRQEPIVGRTQIAIDIASHDRLVAGHE